jgi:hypothetical protein
MKRGLMLFLLILAGSASAAHEHIPACPRQEAARGISGTGFDLRLPRLTARIIGEKVALAPTVFGNDIWDATCFSKNSTGIT